MTREFTADSLVSLPRLNVDSGLAVYQALRTAALAEKKLPKALQPAWQGVDSAGRTLAQSAQLRLADSSTRAAPAERRKADTAVDNAVGALDQFLEAWTRLPDTLPEAQAAVAIRRTLFPDGTGFLKLSFEQQWAQIDRRVALLKSEGLDKELARLGGAAFVAHLEEMHRAYGQALGLTTVPAVAAETVPLRDPLLALSSALRLYVIKVIAHRDDDRPETMALADRLLRPLAAWTGKSPKSNLDSEPPPAPRPEPVPAPVPAPAPG